MKTLPSITLNGVCYQVDHAARVVRRCDRPAAEIPFTRLVCEGDMYTVRFVRGTDNELAPPRHPYEAVVEGFIPALYVEHPPEAVAQVLAAYAVHPLL